MEARDFLTTEQMSKRFKSPFDLVNYAIELAKNAVATGRAARVTTDVQNLAQTILLEILNYQDTFDEAYESDEEEDEVVIVEEVVEKVKVKPTSHKVVAKGT
jgi:hypothetical protein